MAIQLGPNNGLMDRGARGEEHYDQVMRLGWKILLPISLLNILVTALVVLW